MDTSPASIPMYKQKINIFTVSETTIYNPDR